MKKSKYFAIFIGLNLLLLLASCSNLKKVECVSPLITIKQQSIGLLKGYIYIICSESLKIIEFNEFNPKQNNKVVYKIKFDKEQSQEIVKIITDEAFIALEPRYMSQMMDGFYKHKVEVNRMNTIQEITVKDIRVDQIEMLFNTINLSIRKNELQLRTEYFDKE